MTAAHGAFVTGTGTGVGKTFTTAALARRFTAVGKRVFAFKPIETGCLIVDGTRLGEDQRTLARAAGDWQHDELRNLYSFERPLAPLMAARLERATIDLDRIADAYHRGRAAADLVLVEGAGGWRVPITETADMSVLAKQLGLPVLIVATAGLGTINHTVLTVEAILRDGCRLVGVVLSRTPDVDAELARENAVEIRRLTGCRVGVGAEALTFDMFHVER